MRFKISIVLDKRRALNNGQYPVKVRLWDKNESKAKRVSTGISMTDKRFDNSWASNLTPQKLKGQEKEDWDTLDELYKRAETSLKSLNYFSLEGFAQKFYRKSSDKTSAIYHFKKTIESFRKKGRIGAAESYNSALVSLLKYNNQRTKPGKPEKSENEELSFYTITPEWLEGYESYMIDENGRSNTTVAIYTRTLRVIFNNAIDDNDLENKHYPFGKKKYQIPEERKVKKTLTRDQVALLKHAILPPLQDKARDYWFFSYACNGMNFKDMAMLRFEHLEGGYVSYYREKTKLKRRTNKKKISFKLNSLSNEILEKYKTDYRGENSYVFPILDDGDSHEIIYRKVNNWIRATNQQLKHIAKNLDFPKGFSTYWARHSFSTNMINNGASIEQVSEALNHNDISTTQHYFDGFEDKTKNELMEKLIDFS